MIFLPSMSIFNFCHRFVPCLADPARRSSLGLKAALVVLHIVYAGILFLFDSDLIEKTKQEPWSYTGLYLLLFVATLIQYFVASCSSPGYVLDAMRDVSEKNSLFRKASMLSKQPASSKNGSLVITVEGSQPERNIPESNVTSWTKLVLDMYPPGTSVSLHERSIAMIVIDVFFSLTIIVFGLGHALAGEIIVDFGGTFSKKLQYAFWTGILYITSLKANISRAWYSIFFEILSVFSSMLLLLSLKGPGALLIMKGEKGKSSHRAL